MKTREVLRELWDSLDSTINDVCNEAGENIDNAKVRYVHNNVWLYVDDFYGYELMTDAEVGAMGGEYEP